MKAVNITKEQKMLFNLVGHNLFAAPLNIESGVDWDEVINESVAQSLPLIALKNYRELPIDQPTSEKIQKLLKKCTMSNINCFKGHAYLHSLMTKNAIPYCIIKGAASSYYYPDPLLRNMGDVDFYVSPEHLDKAREVFVADGFEWSDTGSPHHFGLQKGRMGMEIHYAPIAIPNDEMRPIFHEYWSDICCDARLVKDVFSEYYLPSEFHHGFILITHFQLHLMPNGVGLRHLCDWVAFADKFSNEEFIEIFEQRLKRVGLWRLAQIISLAAVKHLGMSYKDWMGNDYATADALIEDIARGGNFGKREKDRGFEVLFISDRNTSYSKQPRFIRAIRSMNILIRQRWKAAKKCPLLYPIGWVYFSMRFFYKKLTGRHKVKLMDSYKKSGKRIQLYQSLDLFKPEK